jgi:L-cysteine/cystine lyase
MSGTDSSIKDLQEQRSYFAALSNKAYLSFGGQGTLPKQAVSAIFCSYDYVQTNGPFSQRIFHWMHEELRETKALIGRELNANPQGIALTSSVTDGCNVVMWGIDWQPGDHLLITDCEHSSVVAIAEQISKRFHVALSIVPLTDAEVDPVQAIMDNVNERTRLVALSHVLWNTGRVLPIKELTDACKNRGVWLLVDGAQSAGVMPLDMQALGVDFYAITGHKWYCGPEGVGALYIRPDLIEQLHPTYVGWRGVEALEKGQQDASRFEVATAPFPLLAGLRAAIAVHNDWASAQERFQQIKEKVDYLRQELARIPGCQIMWAGASAGLVSFAIAGKSNGDLIRKLEAENVMVRTIPYPDCLRASVHYLTNRRDIDRLLDVVSR